jgi:hypothetical protein
MAASRRGWRKRREAITPPPKGRQTDVTERDMIPLARYLAVEAGLAAGLSRPGAYLYAADLLASTAAGSVGKWAMKHSHACAAKRWRDTTDFPVMPSCFEPTPEAAEAALRRALERIQGPVPAPSDRSGRPVTGTGWRPGC